MYDDFWDSQYCSMKFIKSIWKISDVSIFLQEELLEKSLAVYREIPHKPIRLYLYAPP